MSEHAISKRYAFALLKLAKEQNALSSVRESLNKFANILHERKDLFFWLADEEVSNSKRETVVREIASVINLHSLVLKFIQLLIVKARIKYIYNIDRIFNDEADAIEGIARGKIITAKKEVGDALLKKVEDVMANKMNKKIILKTVEDESVIGGFFIQIKDTIFDGTIRRKLEIIKENLCQ